MIRRSDPPQTLPPKTLPRSIPAIEWPVVELLFDLGAAHELAPLVRALSDHCRPTAPDHTMVGSARLLSSPFAPEARSRHEPPLPYAVVVRTADEVDHPLAADATALITVGEQAWTAATQKVGTDRAIPLSPYALRSRELLPVSVTTRAQLRRLHQLPDDLVISVGRPHALPLTDTERATALRVAAVADVTGPIVVEALALGTPVVTDAATARLLGAEANRHVLVADSSSSARVAADLAAESVVDPTRTAELGRAARQLVEQRHDADRTALAVVDALGLPVVSATPAAPGLRLGRRLAELGTPTGHPIERQLADRLSDLGVAPRTVGSLT